MNEIHSTAIVGPEVKLGKNNYIGPYCYITGKTNIGDNNRFEAYCSVGTSAEHRDYFTSSNGVTYIGNNNVFREFTTINAGTIDKTILKNNIVMLRGSHVGHDSYISDFVNLSCNVLIGGHSHIMIGANFGLNSMCHQFSTIGAYVMIGMNSVITKNSDIKPGGIYFGTPAVFSRVNEIGLERNKINEEDMKNFIKQYEEKKIH